MTSDNPYTKTRQTTAHDGEIIAPMDTPSELRDPLPNHALTEYMKPDFSLSGIINRRRLRAQLTEDAHKKFRELVITRLSQETDLTLYRSGLRTAAEKNRALAAHIESNRELSQMLNQRVSDFIERMTEGQVDQAEAAEIWAMDRANQIRQRHDKGEIDQTACSNMLGLIENRRDERIRRLFDISERDLDQLSDLVAEAQKTLLRAVQD